TQFNYCFELKPTEFPGFFSSTLEIAPEVTSATLKYTHQASSHGISISTSDGRIYTISGHPTDRDALTLILTNGCKTRTLYLTARSPYAPPCLTFPPDVDFFTVSPNPAINRIVVGRKSNLTKAQLANKKNSEIKKIIL